MNVVGDYINVLESFHQILTRSLAACHFVLGRLREKVVYLWEMAGERRGACMYELCYVGTYIFRVPHAVRRPGHCWEADLLLLPSSTNSLIQPPRTVRTTCELHQTDQQASSIQFQASYLDYNQVPSSPFRRWLHRISETPRPTVDQSVEIRSTRCVY